MMMMMMMMMKSCDGFWAKIVQGVVMVTELVGTCIRLYTAVFTN